MTVSTMLAGLLPLLWAEGSGADVMRRIAAPMIGGLLTSAFLTLEIIPVIYTWWRHEELLWQRLAEAAPARLGRLRGAAWTSALGALGLALAAVAPLYVEIGPQGRGMALALGALAMLGGALGYLAARRGVGSEPEK
jgi:Cu(I)/Ag(I) efflux system membrane protein CusA/SilA